ncbi:MAG: hypothetical protein ACSHX6_03740 [Akkermansiaceae bacterium]
MKLSIILIIASSIITIAKPLTITLEPNKEPDEAQNEEENSDYTPQLIKKFNTLLQENKELKTQFEAYEAGPKENAGGRYLGADARPLLLRQSENVDFNGEGGTKNYKQTIVLYYSFGEGFRRGMEETTGVFALFTLTGQQLYDNKNDKFILTKHTVTATFNGFQKTLNADQQENKTAE